MPRRDRLAASPEVISAGAAATGSSPGPPPVGGEIATDLRFVPGPVNGAVIERRSKAIAVYGDPRGTLAAAELVLFTHHRRDVVWAGRHLVENGAKAVVPAAEQAAFTGVGAFWDDFWHARFHDYGQRTTKVLAEPMPVWKAVADGETLTWEGLAIRVVDTPGYSRGAVSYLVEIDGRRIAFTGDLIYGDGKVLDLYSFQAALPSVGFDAYHGHAAGFGAMAASLRRIAREKPDVIIPARGPVIRNPAEAIEALIGRMQAYYANYLSTDSCRIWGGGLENHARKARLVLGPDAGFDLLPKARSYPAPRPRIVANGMADGGRSQGEAVPPPAWVVSVDKVSSKLILACDGSGFLVDCGLPETIDRLQGLKASGRLTSLEHVFITHAHDDHTDQVPRLVESFGTTVHAVRGMRDVLENPQAYRLPGLTRNRVRVTGRQTPGETWRWKEFEMTMYDFPGQMMYHGALLVKADGGETVFFIGDSFTPAGIDDYCVQNRNFLREGQGYLLCLELLGGRARQAMLINQHLEEAFRFSTHQIRQMRGLLKERMLLLRDLLPWDDVNWGLDENWARFHPYGIELRRGGSATLHLVILNHSARERVFRARVRAPGGARLEAHAAGPVRIPAGQERGLPVEITIAGDAAPGIRVLTADVQCEDWELREWAEAMIHVSV